MFSIMFKNAVRKIVPKRYHPFLCKMRNFLIAPINLIVYGGSEYSCPFCLHSFSRLLPAGLKDDILKEKKIIGGGYRENAVCPYCRSSDRDRLIYLSIKKNNLLKPNTTLLHVAPEANLSKFFRKLPIKYISGDLKSHFAKAQIKMDIQDIPFQSDFFDSIICNHVLEHIVDDKKAMRELYRVLKKGGWAILQVPYSPTLKNTFEDSKITGKEERQKSFGQWDHVRIYGKDYVARLKSVGFKVEQKKLDNPTTHKLALNTEETIFFCRK